MEESTLELIPRKIGDFTRFVEGSRMPEICAAGLPFNQSICRLSNIHGDQLIETGFSVHGLAPESPNLQQSEAAAAGPSCPTAATAGCNASQS